MGSEWRERRIGDLAEIYDGPHATPRTVEEGPLFLGITCLDGGRLDLSKAEHVTEPDFARWTRRVTPRPGDVVFSYETRLGEAARIPPGFRGCLGRRMGLLRPKPEVDPSFLLYAFLGPEFQETLRSRTIHGSTVDRIPLTELGDFRIRIPRIADQRAIGAALAALDDKIDLNRRMSQTLEAMARALFKSWFVDFDPVRAKAEGRDTGLASQAADLFPDSFVDTVLGQIPAGWCIRAITDVCQAIFSGGTPRTDTPRYWGGELPWLSSGETRSRFIDSTENTITWEGVEGSSTRLARAGATVVASAGQGHTRGQTSMLIIDSYINQSVVALVGDARYTCDEHLFFDLERRYEEFRQASDGHSSRGSLTTKLLAERPHVSPPIELVEGFHAAVGPMVASIGRRTRESRMMAEVRDALLPRLLSPATARARRGEAAQSWPYG